MSPKSGAGPESPTGAASARAAAAGSRIKPDDALTDGPILDLKANRSSESGTGKPSGGDSAKGTAAKPPTSGPQGAASSAAKSASPTPAAKTAQAGAGFGALVVAGLVGGLVGAFSMFLLSLTGMLTPQGDRTKLAALEKRVDALATSDAVAALDRRVGAAETALKPLPEAITKAEAAASAGASPGLAERLDALDQRVSALQEEPARDQDAANAKPAASEGGEPVRLADLDVRLKALETKSQAQGGPTVPEEDLAPKVSALQSDLEDRLKAGETASKALGERVDQLQQSFDTRIAAATAAAQQAAKTSQQSVEAGKAQTEQAIKAADQRLQEQNDRIAALDKAVDGSAKATTVQATLQAVAVNRIADALTNGVPYAGALASLRGRDGGDAARLQPLAEFAEKGAPTATALAAEFRPIAERIAAARRSARASALASSGSIGDRLMSMAESVVKVKRVPPDAGSAASGTASAAEAATPDEPEAKVQSDLDRGRVEEAAKSFAALPDDLRTQAEDFGVKLKSVADARAAAQALQADAFEALAPPAPTR